MADSGVTETLPNSIPAPSHPDTMLLHGSHGLREHLLSAFRCFLVGLVVLLPLIFSVTARKLESKGTVKSSPYVPISVTSDRGSGFVARHGSAAPGPLTAIATLKTSVGPTMVYGFISAILRSSLPVHSMPRFVRRRCRYAH